MPKEKIKYEYKIYKSAWKGDEEQKWLNKIGKEGWEIINVSNEGGFANVFYKYLLKRKITLCQKKQKKKG